MENLDLYGIRDNQLRFLASYLTNREQKLKIINDNQSFLSLEETISLDVPQGSIIGPLLFVLHINDLPMSVFDNFCKPLMYDDITNILITTSDLNCAIPEITSVTETV